MKISDEFMQEMLAAAKPYCLVIFKAASTRSEDAARAVIWEHARRNFELRAEGRLAVVCPVTDDGDIRGVAVFSASVDEVRRIVADDPAVKSGVLQCEIRPCLGFPGDRLP